MLTLIIGIVIRIFSNSYLNVFQKLLTQRGEASTVVNFFTYLGITTIGVLFVRTPVFSFDMLPSILIMGFLGALGNYFIVKALSCGELSSLAPLNSYKPVIALIIGILFLNEYPEFIELIGLILIIFGTILLSKSKILINKASFYRFIALILLGTEAVFIKKVILLSDVNSAFLYWVVTGLIFAFIFVVFSKHKIKIAKSNIRNQLLLITLVAMMQYSTNYVFSKMNVAYALALFQLSSIISIFLGANIFKEKGLVKKALASFIMLVGAVFIILN